MQWCARRKCLGNKLWLFLLYQDPRCLAMITRLLWLVLLIRSVNGRWGTKIWFLSYALSSTRQRMEDLPLYSSSLSWELCSVWDFTKQIFCSESEEFRHAVGTCSRLWILFHFQSLNLNLWSAIAAFVGQKHSDGKKRELLKEVTEKMANY